MTTRTETSHWYDGRTYAAVIDRMLGGVHEYVVRHLPEGDRVLDACCGTGALSRRIAREGRSVVGVDLSPRHIDYARRVTSSDDVRFELGDVAQHPAPPDGPYDAAVICLALHEMPAELRLPVLGHLLEVAGQVMVVDFAAPMRRNLAGLRNRATEVAAGLDHFAAFRDWQRQGGLGPLVGALPAQVLDERTIDSDTLRVTTVTRSG
jgi:ubiquinone/menaquinone biosynthesis C-methylase UbiE